MILTREQVLAVGYLIIRIKEKNNKCNINLKYKILKLENILKEEFEITSLLLNDLTLKYAELDENKQPVIKEGGIKIIEEKALDLQKELAEFKKATIQIPEIYFSIDELEELDLSWNELSSLMPFIK